MNNEQIKFKIALLTEQRKLAESFLLPIFTGIILTIVGKNFLGNIFYFCLFAFGCIVIIALAIVIKKLNNKILLLINQIK